MKVVQQSAGSSPSSTVQQAGTMGGRYRTASSCIRLPLAPPPLRPTFALVAYNLRPPPPPPCPAASLRYQTVAILRSSFPKFRRRSALVAKRCLSSRPAAAFARTTVLTDVAVSRSFVRMNAEKISDTLAFASPALRSRSPSMLGSGGAP